MCAPIVLFTYARPKHTRLTIESLLKNHGVHQHDLIVYSDAHRTENQKSEVSEVREYLKNINGFRSVTVIHRPHNFGLANSIVDGVTSVLQSYPNIIVLEDDMLTSPYFLKYMDEALERFENEDDVISIHGYVYPVKTCLPEAFFLRGADCWGWATWRRGWSLFNPDGNYLLSEIRRLKLSYQFDFDGTYKFTKMLENQVKGINDSWAVRWYASAFLSNKLTLYPGESLVYNIGMDDSGVHSRKSDWLNVDLALSKISLNNVQVRHSNEAFNAISEFFNSNKPKFFERAHSALTRLLNIGKFMVKHMFAK